MGCRRDRPPRHERLRIRQLVYGREIQGPRLLPTYCARLIEGSSWQPIAGPALPGAAVTYYDFIPDPPSISAVSGEKTSPLGPVMGDCDGQGCAGRPAD